MRICSIDGCGGKHKGHGYCNKHYQKWRQYGDPLYDGRYRNEWSLDFLLSKCAKTDTGCLVYPTSEGEDYGVFGYMGRAYKAHRAALEMKLGRPLSDGMCSCHTCDNPPCCNPDHLFEGTRRDNNLDRASKGRNGAARGMNASNRTLDEDQVLEIRRRYRAGALVADLAREYDVSWTAANNVVHRRTWAHLTEEE